MFAFLLEVDKALVASWSCVEGGRHLESTQGAANSALECESGRALGSLSRIREEVWEEASQANRASLGDHEGLEVFMVEQVVERGSGGPKEIALQNGNGGLERVRLAAVSKGDPIVAREVHW
eukprot:2711470-Pyramimonas_sp.AAC.1